MRARLDVNVLIALLDAAHLNHGIAHAWLVEEKNQSWASCPITQNGCVRIMSQPSYPGGPFAVAEVAAPLKEAMQGHHEFWADDISTVNSPVFNWQHLLGHRQITDAYLLALAVKNAGRFVSFDEAISVLTVKGASKAQCEVLR